MFVLLIVYPAIARLEILPAKYLLEVIAPEIIATSVTALFAMLGAVTALAASLRAVTLPSAILAIAVMLVQYAFGVCHNIGVGGLNAVFNHI